MKSRQFFYNSETKEHYSIDIYVDDIIVED